MWDQQMQSERYKAGTLQDYLKNCEVIEEDDNDLQRSFAPTKGKSDPISYENLGSDPLFG